MASGPVCSRPHVRLVLSSPKFSKAASTRPSTASQVAPVGVGSLSLTPSFRSQSPSGLSSCFLTCLKRFVRTGFSTRTISISRAQGSLLKVERVHQRMDLVAKRSRKSSQRGIFGCSQSATRFTSSCRVSSYVHQLKGVAYMQM